MCRIEADRAKTRDITAKRNKITYFIIRLSGFPSHEDGLISL